MHLEVCSVWVDFNLLNKIILQKVSQLDLGNQIKYFHQFVTPVVVGKEDFGSLGASVGSLNNLLPDIASKLATFDLVSKEHHISWLDDRHHINFCNSSNNKSTHVGLCHMNNLVDLFSIKVFSLSNVYYNVSSRVFYKRISISYHHYPLVSSLTPRIICMTIDQVVIKWSPSGHQGVPKWSPMVSG